MNRTGWILRRIVNPLTPRRHLSASAGGGYQQQDERDKPHGLSEKAVESFTALVHRHSVILLFLESNVG